MNRIIVSWQDYEELVRKIARHVQSLSFQPEIIIGVARGGLPLMVSVASFFNIRQTGIFFMQHTVTDEAFAGRLSGAVCHGSAIPFPVQGKRALLVDDIIRSGGTITASTNMLREMGAEYIAVATLYIDSTNCQDNWYSAAIVEPNTWIVFPWDNLSVDT